MKTFNAFIILLVMFSVGVEGYFFIFTTNHLYTHLSDTILQRIIFYFSFFTVLSSLVLAIGCLCVIKNPYYKSQIITILRIDGVVSIIITGVVYNIALRSLHHPDSFTLKVTNECLRVIIPILGIMGWLLFDPHPRLTKKIVFYAAIAPIVYVFYIYIRGAITGLYPYPILNVVEIGYFRAILNTFIIVILFIGCSALFYFIDKLPTFQR